MNSGAALLPALLATAFIFRPEKLVRILPAVMVILAVLLLNWHDSLYAKAVIGPDTDRVHQIMGLRDLTYILYPIANLFGQFGQLEVPTACLLAFVFTWMTDRARTIRVGIVIPTVLIGGYCFGAIHWAELGIPLLDGVQFHYVSYAIFPLSYLMFGASLQQIRWDKLSAASIAYRISTPALLLAVTAGNLVWYKAYTLSNWLSLGGLGVVGQAEEVASAYLRKAAGYRVVTVPYRLPPGLMSANGFETLDGFVNLRTKLQGDYWHQGVLKFRYKEVGQSLMKSPKWNFRCCDKYEFDQHVETDFFRVANVKYVFSKLELEDRNLAKVGVLAGELPVPRSSQVLHERLLGYAKLITNPAAIHVYEIRNPLPRVYPAQGMRIVPKTASLEDYLEAVREGALQRLAVVQGPDASRLPDQIGRQVSIVGYEQSDDAISVNMRADSPGLIVLNLPYSRHWQAWVDGVPTELHSVNQIHMAAQVPDGAAQLVLHYKRPTLLDRLSDL
jgi:hypothetical protein